MNCMPCYYILIKFPKLNKREREEGRARAIVQWAEYLLACKQPRFNPWHHLWSTDPPPGVIPEHWARCKPCALSLYAPKRERKKQSKGKIEKKRLLVKDTCRDLWNTPSESWLSVYQLIHVSPGKEPQSGRELSSKTVLVIHRFHPC